ncbi:MAG TPA: hypothetical protein VG621_01230 [Candidatus Paceibacterota bacterium]|nr:hypothetical protein [Candidatus Paceibacterota bacterium]
MSDTPPALSWETLEYEEKDRHPDWIWYAGLIFGIGAALAFFYHDLFFGIFLVIAGIAVIGFALRPPRYITIALGEKGISVDEEYILYERVRQFWIDETSKPDKLLLLVKGSFVPMLALPLHGEVTAETVRDLLKTHTQEIEMHESFATKLFERFGF